MSKGILTLKELLMLDPELDVEAWFRQRARDYAMAVANEIMAAAHEAVTEVNNSEQAFAA